MPSVPAAVLTPDATATPVRASDLRTADRKAKHWQPAPANTTTRTISPKAKRYPLADLDPAAKPFSIGDKISDHAAMESLASQLGRLQNLFYADRRFKLLVVLQGTDTSGKDGTLRSVFNRMSPLGVRTVGWKAPTQAEQAHDFLWRIHAQMPGKGETVVFNRSHYEDVLVPPVNGWITPQQTAQRYAQINDFERMLTENGTVVLKFMLHISFEEQRERLQERIDDETKHWKFDLSDIEARKQWKPYQKAYQKMLQATSTAWAPWTVVPANSKMHRNLMVATLLRNALVRLDLRYPPGNPSLKGIQII